MSDLFGFLEKSKPGAATQQIAELFSKHPLEMLEEEEE